MGILSYLKFGRSENTEDILVANIEFDSIKTILINIDEQKKKFSIIGSNKEWTESQFTKEESLNFQGLKSNFQKSVHNLLKNNKSSKKPKKLIAVSSIGLIESISFDFEFTRTDPQKKIDMPEIKEILEKSFEAIHTEISQSRGQNGEERLQDIFKVTNGVIQNTSVDGYSVAHPLGFQGKKVKLNIFCSFLPNSYFAALSALAEEIEMQLLDVRHRIELLAEYFLNKSSKNAFFINIGGHFTESLLIKDGQIKGVDFFTVGGSSFTKSLAKNMGIGFIEAETLKLNYSQNKLKKEVAEKIKNILSNDVAFWAGQMRSSMTKLLKNELMPEKIYLTGGGAVLPEILKSFEADGPILKNLPTLAPIESFLLSMDTTENFTGTTKSINPTADAAIIATGYAALNILERNGLNSLFKNIIKNA